DGVWIALNNGNGTFQAPQFVLAAFDYNAGGWRVDMHPRFLTDVTGDGRADIVGFGNDGVWIGLNNGNGTFQAPQFVLADFGLRSAVRRKVISLDFLQRKFDLFFNQRARPLFQIRLDSKEKKFGESALTVAMDDSVKGYDHDHPQVLKELA